VPTVGERLATLERIAIENRDKIDGVLDAIDGGGDIDYTRSVRGRLHAIEGTLNVLGFYTRLLRGWRSLALLSCAVITAAASIYSAIGR
jgi:hypothetical protein